MRLVRRSPGRLKWVIIAPTDEPVCCWRCDAGWYWNVIFCHCQMPRIS